MQHLDHRQQVEVLNNGQIWLDGKSTNLTLVQTDTHTEIHQPTGKAKAIHRLPASFPHKYSPFKANGDLKIGLPSYYWFSQHCLQLLAA